MVDFIVLLCIRCGVGKPYVNPNGVVGRICAKCFLRALIELGVLDEKDGWLL